MVLMVIFSPISHVHYFTYCLPLVMSLLLSQWEGRTTLHLDWRLAVAFVWFFAATALPALPPGMDTLRDLCLPLFGALPLWAIAVVRLWRNIPDSCALEPAKTSPLAA